MDAPLPITELKKQQHASKVLTLKIDEILDTDKDINTPKKQSKKFKEQDARKAKDKKARQDDGEGYDPAEDPDVVMYNGKPAIEVWDKNIKMKRLQTVGYDYCRELREKKLKKL